MKKIFLLAFLFVLSQHSIAQMGYGKVEDIKELKNRTLLVEMKKPSEKQLKKLSKKPEKLAELNKAIEQYNDALKKSFTNWSHSKDIKFVSLDEIEEIRDDKKRKDQYSYFRSYYTSAPMSSSRGSMNEYKYSVGLTDNKKAIYIMQYDSYDDFNQADAIFILNQFDFYFEGRLKMKDEGLKRKELMEVFKKRAKVLKTKTLYVNKDRISSDLEQKIKSVYKYKYKITSKEEIDKAIIDRIEDVVYVKFVPVAQASSGNKGAVKISKRKYAQYFVDASTGETVAFIMPGMSIGVVGGGNSKTSIKDLKSIMKDIESK